MKKLLHEIIRERRLVCDGAMGTQLMLAGLESGGCGELWNLTHPERILEIQKRYVAAGVDCLITNTFGGNRIMLQRHGHADELKEINQAGVAVARKAFGGNDGYVLGDMGPLGAILEPYGDLPQEEAYAAYKEQASVLVDAGADAVIIETQTSLDEIGIAVDAAKSAGTQCIIASLAYDLSADKTFYVTMMGVLPDHAAAFLEEKGVNIIALNCGTGMDMEGAVKVVSIYKKTSTLPTMIQPNAGLPILEGGKAVYKQLPGDMAMGVPKVLEAGANIIGSCCGSTPEHTHAIFQVISKYNR